MAAREDSEIEPEGVHETDVGPPRPPPAFGPPGLIGAADGPPNARAPDWIVGGGEMGRLIRSMDWRTSHLGPIDSWPQSLRTTVGLCLASNFPISLAWGRHHVQIYNDGYWPICGGKHPHSMGQDFSKCWASAWPVIGEAFASALSGETRYLEDQRMFLDRNGYLEETFFTFSFSPIRDESGEVAGLFHPVTETTTRMLSERRTRTLRDLAARSGTAKTIEEAFALAARTLSDSALDLPFVLFYLFDEQGRVARLVGQAGLSPGTAASPEVIGAEETEGSGWPLNAAGVDPIRLVDDLESRFGPIRCGPYPEPVTQAVAIQIALPGQERSAGMLVAGVSTRLPLDENYRAFYDLLAAGIAGAAANAHAYEAERARAEALAEIDRAKTTFFSNVSHEFRTPLTLILSPIEDALGQPARALAGESLEAVRRNAVRLLRLVNSLLDFARIEAGRLDTSFVATDLSALTTDLASSFRSLVEGAGLKLTVDCPPLPQMVHIDVGLWEKIVLNLLSNAFKFTLQGELTVRLRHCQDHIELSVSDTGCGVPERELPRMFERFHRIEGAQGRSFEGSGIGLSLVHEFTKLHGGTVCVESVEGKGSSFVVAIPTGRAHPSSDRVVGTTATSPGAAITSTPHVLEALAWVEKPDVMPIHDASVEGSRSMGAASPEGAPRARVLVADDNADMRRYLARTLGTRWSVELASDGEVALASARARPPDLILSDVMMPRLDGVGLLRALRGDPKTRSIPVVLLSARAGDEAVLEGLETGADDYLVKPFSARELVARVQTHLQMAGIRREAAEAARELADTRATLLADLQRKNEELEAFSYSVSHDLRTPLRHIAGFIELLKRHAGSSLSEQASRDLAIITESVGRMDTMIDDLLSFSRMCRTEMVRSRVDLSELIGTVRATFENDLRDRQVEWRIGKLPTVTGDPAMLRLVLANLLGNAVKYTGGRPVASIRVEAIEHESEDVVAIHDNGAGFDMQQVARLFGVFQRLHRSEEFEGTGIGLANVRRIISRHGGRTWATGEVGRGATFYFSLPRTLESSKEPRIAA